MKKEKNSKFYFILNQKSNVPFDPRIKVPFSLVFFGKLIYEIRNQVLIFVSILKLRHKTIRALKVPFNFQFKIKM